MERRKKDGSERNEGRKDREENKREGGGSESQ